MKFFLSFFLASGPVNVFDEQLYQHFFKNFKLRIV
jgi:hypothetical protein